MRSPGWQPLAALLASSGVLHLLRPAPYAAIVPRRLGRPTAWVYVSGVAEIACAATLARSATRRRAGLASAVLLVAVFPANVQMAVTATRSSRASTLYRALALGRLPLQVPLVAWALSIARSAPRRDGEVGP